VLYTMHAQKLTASRTVTLSLASWAQIADLMERYNVKNLEGVAKILLANWKQNHE